MSQSRPARSRRGVAQRTRKPQTSRLCARDKTVRVAKPGRVWGATGTRLAARQYRHHAFSPILGDSFRFGTFRCPNRDSSWSKGKAVAMSSQKRKRSRGAPSTCVHRWCYPYRLTSSPLPMSPAIIAITVTITLGVISATARLTAAAPARVVAIFINPTEAC